MATATALGAACAGTLGDHCVEQIVSSSIEFAGDILQAEHIGDVEFCRDIEPGLRLRGSCCDWQRVLVNLLVHAGERMKEGGIVELCARKSGNGIELSVTDNGPKIPEAHIPSVFRPGFSSRHRGSAMGLHVVESLVRRNGGAVSAHNRPGGGAEFRIMAPR